MIKVIYFYSSCVGIETPETGILCDPWFTEGAYDGSWYQFPKLSEPIEKIGFFPWIYVSHIHPDHYDPIFLQSYLCKYPEAKVIIAPFRNNWLSKKMTSDGIPHQILADTIIEEKTSFRVFTNESSLEDIDSALAVKCAGHSVVNMNDNMLNLSQIAAIRDFCAPEVTIALLGYTGAGPYPQTYYDDPVILQQKALKKRVIFSAATAR